MEVLHAMTIKKAILSTIVCAGCILLASNYNLPMLDKVVMSDTKEIFKCVTKQIQTNQDEQSQVKGFIDPQDNVPKEMLLLAGDKFIYKCCGKKRAIYQWGLYKHGSPFPHPLICRVDIKKSGICFVSWATDFNASSYSNRISVEYWYKKSSSCVLWSIENVTKTDEKSYVAFLRDIFISGHTFKPCPPVSLKVTTVEPLQPVSTKQPVHASDKPTTSPITQNPSQTITEENKSTITRHPKRGSNSQNQPTIYAAVGVISAFILSLPIALCIWKRRIIISKIRTCIERCQTEDDRGNVALREQSTTPDSK